METFEDKLGKRRSISLTIGRARRAAKQTDADFLDGDPAKLANDLLIRPTLQLDLIWFLLDGKDALELSGVVDEGGDELTGMDAFEEKYLDSEAFDQAKLALNAEIGNFIQSLRPEFLGVFQEATQLIRSQITESAKRAASLLQSKEVKEGFLQANADAEKKAKAEISKQFSKLQADSE